MTMTSWMSLCLLSSESVGLAFAFVMLVFRRSVLHLSRTPDDAAPSPCVDRRSRNNGLNCILNKFHLLYVHNSNRPVDGKMFHRFLFSNILHPYVRTSRLMFAINAVAGTAYFAVDFFHFNSFLCYHIDSSRFGGGDGSLNF